MCNYFECCLIYQCAGVKTLLSNQLFPTGTFQAYYYYRCIVENIDTIDFRHFFEIRAWIFPFSMRHTCNEWNWSLNRMRGLNNRHKQSECSCRDWPIGYFRYANRLLIVSGNDRGFIARATNGHERSNLRNALSLLHFMQNSRCPVVLLYSLDGGNAIFENFSDSFFVDLWTIKVDGQDFWKFDSKDWGYSLAIINVLLNHPHLRTQPHIIN